MIKFENVGVVYPGGVKALENINLEINEGDFVIIVGLSGAGKSTLLRSINNLVKPTSGNVVVDGNQVTNASKKELKKIRSDIGMIFQTFNLVNRSSVLKNVLTGRLSQVSTIRSITGLWPKEDKQIAFDALERVEILEKAYVRGSNLSGGQQQRVAIARAIAGNRPLLLADEPTGNLDIASGGEVLQLFKDLCHDEDNPISILMVTHDPDLASKADRMLLMREGKVAASDIRSAWGLDEGGEEE